MDELYQPAIAVVVGKLWSRQWLLSGSASAQVAASEYLYSSRRCERKKVSKKHV